MLGTATTSVAEGEYSREKQSWRESLSPGLRFKSHWRRCVCSWPEVREVYGDVDGLEVMSRKLLLRCPWFHWASDKLLVAVPENKKKSIWKKKLLLLLCLAVLLQHPILPNFNTVSAGKGGMFIESSSIITKQAQKKGRFRADQQ